MSHIRVTRHLGWTDKLRSYRLLVDGKDAGALKEGGEITVHVAAGVHDVQVRIDWCSSPVIKVSVKPGATELVTCAPRFNPLTALLGAVFCRHRYLRVERQAEPDRAV